MGRVLGEADHTETDEVVGIGGRKWPWKAERQRLGSPYQEPPRSSLLSRSSVPSFTVLVVD